MRLEVEETSNWLAPGFGVYGDVAGGRVGNLGGEGIGRGRNGGGAGGVENDWDWGGCKVERC